MNSADLQSFQSPGDGVLLGKAFLRAGTILGLKQKDLAGVLGKSEPTLSRLANQGLPIAPGGKDGEIALLFLRMFRSLDALFGGREEDARQWFTSFNHDLSGVPRDRVKTLQGLFDVVNYLDAMRGSL